MRDAFKDDCAYYGGEWHSYPNALAVEEGVGGTEAQESLSNPDQHPIAISSSTGEEGGADLEGVIGEDCGDAEEDVSSGIKDEM